MSVYWLFVSITLTYSAKGNIFVSFWKEVYAFSHNKILKHKLVLTFFTTHSINKSSTLTYKKVLNHAHQSHTFLIDSANVPVI